MTDVHDTAPAEPFAAERPDATVRPGDTQVVLEVDLAAERPTHTLHGLRPDRASRRIAIAMGVVAVAIVAVFAFVGDDETPAAEPEHAGAVARLEPQLRAPMDGALAQIEAMRAEPITLAAIAANQGSDGRRRATRSSAGSSTARAVRPARGTSSRTAGDRDAVLARPVPPPPEQPPAAPPQPRERPGLPGVADLEDAEVAPDEGESAAPS